MSLFSIYLHIYLVIELFVENLFINDSYSCRVLDSGDQMETRVCPGLGKGMGCTQGFGNDVS